MEKQLSRRKILGNIRFARNFTKLTILIFLLLALQFFVMVKRVDSFFAVQASLFVMFSIYMLILCLIWHRRFGTYTFGLNEDLVLAQIIWVAMRENFQNVQFNSQSQIPEAAIRFPGFSFTQNNNIYRPEHYATAQWGNTPIELQHMTVGVLTTHTRTSDGPGESSTYKTLDPSFKGMMYLCHLGRPFTPTIVHTGKPLVGETKTGDAAFDQIFSVRTVDPHTMPLTDGVRRFLTETVGKFRGKVYIHFAASGDVYLAFHQKIFEGRSKRDLEAFERLDHQSDIVKGLLNGLTMGF